MFSLEDLLGPQQGSQAVDQMSQQVGAQPSAVGSAVQMALPMILNQLANNAATPQGAQSLNNALEQDHSGGGGMLDSLGGLGGLASAILGGGQTSRQTDAGGILSHIFGSSQGRVAQQVSNHTGLNTGQTAQILMMLAPLVMNYLGRKKQEQGLDSSGLSNMLGEQQQQIQQSPQGRFLNSMLDRDGDGSVTDDIASMAMNYFSNRR